jgi:hypothetical protein
LARGLFFSIISGGLFGKPPIDGLLRLGGDFFFCSKRSHRKSILRHSVGYGEIGVKLLALKSIEPLGHRTVELQEFFTNPAPISR